MTCEAYQELAIALQCGDVDVLIRRYLVLRRANVIAPFDGDVRQPFRSRGDVELGGGLQKILLNYSHMTSNFFLV